MRLLDTPNPGASLRIYPTLQLPISSFDNLRIHILLIQLNHLPIRSRLTTLPPQCSQPLRQNRMAIMITRIHPVRVHGTQILHLQLNQTFRQFLLKPQVEGEAVRFELEFAGQDVHEELDDGVHGREGVGEENEADDDGALGVEAERGVERAVVDEDGEEGEDVEHVELALSDCAEQSCGETYLSNGHQLSRVRETPMAELMAEDSDHFLRIALLDQSVIDDDMLLPWQTKKVCIAVSAPLAAVNDI